MKLIAYLLMALATMAGSISAATAYLVPIGVGKVDDAKLTTITLAAPAGAYIATDALGEPTEEALALEKRLEKAREAAAAAAPPAPAPLLEVEPVEVETPPLPEVETEPTGTQRLDDRQKTEPIAEAGDTLTGEMLAILRDNKVDFVKSTSFEPRIWFTIWPSWVFLGSLVLLLVAAMLVRSASRAPGRTAPAVGASAEGGPAIAPDDPAAIALAIQEEVERTVRDIQPLATEREQLELIVDRLGEVQRTLVPAFASARPTIIARSGMGGYAQVMDVFAAAERRINRAWSAAADGAEPEALEALHEADAILPALVERLRAG